MHRFAKKCVFVLLVGAIALMSASPAFAQPAVPAAPPPAGLTVSTPAGTLPAQPGTVVDTWLRVGNQAAAPINVTILPATVKLENNGASSFGSQEDPRFAGQITFSTTETAVPAGGYVEVKVKVAIPTNLIPDTYVLGFLVTPDITGGSVRVVNQIGALVVLDVPGPRDRNLIAEWSDAPSLIFNDHPELTYRATSTGKSALQFGTEAAITGYGPATPDHPRTEALLLPSGLYRDGDVAWSVPWGIGLHTVTVTMLYPQTQLSTAQVVLTKTVLVITPLFMMIAGGGLLLIVVLIVVLVRRRRRRKAQYVDLVRRASGAIPVSEESPFALQGASTEVRTRKMERDAHRDKPRSSRWGRG